MRSVSADNEYRMNVVGIGVVSRCGRGPDAHVQADQDAVGAEEESGIRVSRVLPETLKDRAVLKGMRRADRFSKMAALAAHDAAAAGFVTPGDNDIGIIVSTAYGPHNTTFAFLDEILDFGDAAVSPTRFSHSVHNAAASYVATLLGCRGPACTIADFESPLHAALQTADLWLRAGRCKGALVGCVEEASKPLNYALATKYASTRSEALQPFSFSTDPRVAVSEGSVFLALNLSAVGERPIDLQDFAGKNKIADVGALLRRLGWE